MSHDETTQRDAYVRALLSVMHADPRVWCLDSDVGGYRKEIAGELPGQYVDLGIAEATLVSVAAGIARAGKLPFLHTMATFLTTRACEQVKIDVAYPGLPVRMVVTHAGLSAGHYGPTHHALEDVAIMRAFPGMTVVVPADVHETAAAVRAMVDLPGPAYLRLGRGATPPVHQGLVELKLGRAALLRPGDDVTLLASGALPVLACLEAHERLRADGVSARVLNVHTLKPIDVEAIVSAADETRALVTVEDHSVVGGLGSAVAEVITEHSPCPVLRIGVRDTYNSPVGSHGALLAHHGVTADAAVAAARQLLCRRTAGC